MSASDAELSTVKRALVELREMRARLREAERVRTEPIAVVGLGLRLPGGIGTPESFWSLLAGGRSVVGEVPPDRWIIDDFYSADPDAPGTMSSRYGGFLDGVDRFDARFFGITPREAAAMDPQQRLLLETAWAALEHAGQAPDRLAGSPTGVFVGLSTTDYLASEVKFSPREDLDAYLASGGTASVASGRVSYMLGLQGPSMTIDSACSSSLSAVHLACQSLRLGECRMALAGGVNLILLPELNVGLSRAHMLASDGRCKTFDASADGYVRGEGCGVVVLKRLVDAVAAGDRVLAVIRGSAINQDGRSSGLTVPNGPAQESVIREALTRAGVSPSEVGYLEAHGTGTSLGDPIELRALGRVFEGRAGDLLPVGSVKTNVGHLEPAAGVMGLIKVVLALEHGQIPAHLNVTRLTPHVPWDELPLTVPLAPVAWPRDERRRRVAGVSSFGYSGTNVHVIVEEAPPASAETSDRERPCHVLTVSAKTVAALRAAAAGLARHLDSQADGFADVCHTANVGRAHFGERAAIVASSAGDASPALAALAEGRSSPAVRRGTVGPAAKPEVAFLFTGIGSQAPGMGRELFETQPVFRAALERCEEALRPHLDRPLTAVLYPAHGETSPIDETTWAQPALFAFEYALVELWRSWGVTPSLVLGHSLGEDVAACVAGVFGLEDGLQMVARRARLMATLPTGAMAAVFAPEDRVRSRLAATGLPLTIAAINGPHQVVVSGAPADVQSFVRDCERSGVRTRTLAATLACHSALMDPVLGQIEALAAALPLSAPHTAFVSNVTGRLAAAGELTDATYWRRHVRDAVRFSDCAEAAYAFGVRVFLEIGPNGALTANARRVLPQDGITWLHSLTRDESDWRSVLGALAALYAEGVPVAWDAFDRGYPRRKVALPTYPFERERHWSAAVPVRGAGDAAPRSQGHPLLGRRFRSPAVEATVFESVLSLGTHPWLGDHRLDGEVVVPAAAWVEMALAAGGVPADIDAFEVELPLLLRGRGARIVQLLLAGDGAFEIVAAHGDEDDIGWVRLAKGTRRPAPTRAAPGRIDLAECRARAEEMAPEVLYGALQKRGLAIGPSFRAIQRVWRAEGEALAELELPEPLVRGAGAFVLHPVLLAACGHVAQAALWADAGPDTRVVSGASRVRMSAPAGTRLVVHVAADATAASPDAPLASVTLLDADGTVLGTIEGLRFADARPAVDAEWTSDWLYDLAWRNKPRSDAHGQSERRRDRTEGAGGRAHAADDRPVWLVLADEAGVGSALAERIAVSGARTIRVARQGAGGSGRADAVLDPLVPGAFDTLIADAGSALAGVVHLWSVDSPRAESLTASQLEAGAVELTGGALHLVQALARTGRPIPTWFVTADAVSPTGAAPGGLAQAPLWGLARTVALEHPELWGGIVDLDASRLGDAADALALEIAEPGDEDQIALRDGRRYVPRIARAGRVRIGATSLREDGSYLVTGGTGGLGLEVAKTLAARGARHLVLLSRSGLPPREQWPAALPATTAGRAMAAVRALEASGTAVVVHAASVADPDGMERLFASFGREWPALRGIVHAAAHITSGKLVDADLDTIRASFGPKIAGTALLHRLASTQPLDFFVLFSSSSGLSGSTDLGPYAASNVFLDAFAVHARANGAPVTSISWGAWDRMRVDGSLGEAQVARSGMGRMQADVALDALVHLLAPERPHFMVASVQWPTLRAVYEVKRVRPIFDEVAPTTARRAVVKPAGESAILLKLGGARPGDRLGLLTAHVREEAARVLGLQFSHLDPKRGLFDLGMDSLMSVDLKGRLEATLGLPLPATLTFNHPTVAAIAEYLLREIAAPQDAAAATPVMAGVASAALAAAASGPAATPAEDAVEDLSEDDLAMLLAARLAGRDAR